MSEKQLSMGLKIILIFAALFITHSISNVAGQLGLISDIFILLGLISSVRFITNSDVREELLYNLDNVINLEDINQFIKKIVEFITDQDFSSMDTKLKNFLSNLTDSDQEEEEEEEEENVGEDEDNDNMDSPIKTGFYR